MRTRSKLALIGFGATMLMAFAIGTASARNLSISNQNIRMTFNNIELIGEEISTTSCHLTLEGSFHTRTLVKTPNTLVGLLTRVTTANCNHPVRILTLPWHIRYAGFSGTLPNITLIIAKAVGVAIDIEPGVGFQCLTEATLEFRAVRDTATRVLTGVTIPTQEVALGSGGGFGCPVSTGSLSSNGTGGVTVLGAATSLTVTLI